MSNIPISSLPIAVSLTGEEQVPLVQAGTTKRTTTGAISALPIGQGTANSGISFITVTSSFSALPNSRVLAAAAPVTLTDAGTSAAITIGFSTGTAGYVLTANGTSLAATFQAAPATGVTSVGLDGGTTGLTISNSPITTSGTMTISGTLGVPNGGTGTTTIPANRVLVGDTVGSSITSVAAATTAGYFLTSVVGGPPQWQSHAGVGTVTSVALTAPTLGLTVGGSPVTTNGTLTLSGFLNGTAIATASITATQIATNTIGFAQIQQVAALSIVGVTGNSTANLAAISGTTRQVLAVNTGGTALVFAQPRGDQLLGTNTNDNASTGNVGEYVSVTVTSANAVSMSNGAGKTVGSASFGPGDWDICGVMYARGATATQVAYLFTGSSLTDNTVDLTTGAFNELTYNNETPFNVLAQVGIAVPAFRRTFTGTTTVYMVGLTGFTVSTLSTFGLLSGRRMR